MDRLDDRVFPGAASCVRLPDHRTDRLGLCAAVALVLGPDTGEGRERRWQAHDYRKRAGLLRAGEIRSVEILFRLVLSANRIKLGPVAAPACRK
jgi:hypothetical protein